MRAGDAIGPRGGAPALRTLVVIVGLTATVSAAAAQVQAPPQRRCITALAKAGAGLAAARTRALGDCVARAGAGKLPAGGSLRACLAADDERRVAATRTRVERELATTCRQPPAFGMAAAETSTAVPQRAAVAEALFGADLDGAVLAAAAHPGGAHCQAEATRNLVRLAAAQLRAFCDCGRRGLRTATIRSRADLEACVGSDPSGRVARTAARGRARTRRACATVASAEAFPGRCAGAGADALFDCLAAAVACETCRTLNAASDLARPCHSSEHGVAVTYCGERPVPRGSIAREWNEEILAAIRRDTPRPTVHARNLFHLSAAMWDAWRAYGGGGTAVVIDETHASADPDADRSVAISFAAYRVLAHRYALSVDAPRTLLRLDRAMAALGFDRSFTATTGDLPAAIGNRIGAAVIAAGHADGGDEHADYDDPAYAPANGPLIVKLGGAVLADPNRWQPLALDFFVTQNGIATADKVQKAIGMRWRDVTSFALGRRAPDAAALDPGPPPQLGTATDADYKAGAVRVIELTSQLTPDDGTTIDVSPGAYGNNPLGTNDGKGHLQNPATGRPYASHVVKRGDFGRVLAEFWADGPDSETPPGHWNVLANAVTDALPATARRIGGDGDVVGALEWDVKLYLALNGALHDAAITAWSLKRTYDSVRPISMIRWLGAHGQSSDPRQPSYDPRGLPLVPGLIEVVTPASSAPGERHEALRRFTYQIAVRGWPGQPAHPESQYGSVGWMRAVDWIPYQKSTFVTPAFAGYTSGHSTFSRAAAEVLSAFTGSPFFPGGLGEFVARAGSFLTFEHGPTTDVRLQWATYYDAADQAGQSRLWGGIHVPADDLVGRRTGAEVGRAAYDRARAYFAPGR